jgi:hypothetical protein
MNRVLVVNYEAGKGDGGQESLPETRSSLNYEFNFHKVAEEAKFLKESTKDCRKVKGSSVDSGSRSDSDDEFLNSSYINGLESFLRFANLQETVASEDATEKK